MKRSPLCCTVHYVSGAYATGALFATTITLPKGSHTFAVLFADNTMTPTASWADPFAQTYNLEDRDADGLKLSLHSSRLSSEIFLF
jgi:hypothetical protein